MRNIIDSTTASVPPVQSSEAAGDIPHGERSLPVQVTSERVGIAT